EGLPVEADTAVEDNCGIATMEPLTDSDTAGAHTGPGSLGEPGTESLENLQENPQDTDPLGLTPDEVPFPHPDAIVAEDSDGNPVTAQRVNTIDQMSQGQK